MNCSGLFEKVEVLVGFNKYVSGSPRLWGLVRVDLQEVWGRGSVDLGGERGGAQKL